MLPLLPRHGGHAHPHLAEADGHHEAGQLQARFQGGFGDGGGLVGAESRETVGKTRYAQTDARKFQDYVVNEAPAPGAPPLAPLAPLAPLILQQLIAMTVPNWSCAWAGEIDVDQAVRPPWDAPTKKPS